MKYYTIHEFSKLVGKTPQTLRNWDKRDILKPHHTSTNGYRYYADEQVNRVLRIKISKPKIVIGYCRVSSSRQKDDLQRQIENVKSYLIAQGQPFEMISDVGGGVNCSKVGLRQLINRVQSGEVQKIVVLRKNRLLSVGFELIKYIAELNDCTVEVIDNTDEVNEQELVEDVIAVIANRLPSGRTSVIRRLVRELLTDV